MPKTNYAQLPLTLEEAVIVSTSNLSIVQNILKGNKIEKDYDLAHNMFKTASIFSLIFVGWGDVLALCSPFKERDTWKEKAEPMELKCINLQKELITLPEKVEVTDSLQEVMEVYGSTSVLEARVT